MPFDDFEIDPRCLRVLQSQGIEIPTPVQEQAIPIALTGRDVVATAQTGTGKTLAFTLPALTTLAAGPLKHNMMLVLAPTRELAVQTHSVIEEMGKALGINSVCIYGGVNMDPQVRALRQGRSVIVATPGRLLDHMGRGNIRFEDLLMLVLDEADRMLDMGFLPDIRRILAKLPRDRQTLMFSATFPREIERLSRDMLNDPERVTVGSISQPVDAVRQTLYTVQRTEKSALLEKILKEEDIQSALIFVRTKARAERLGRSLRKTRLKSQVIHGDRSQKQREQALDGFRSGRYQLLVATDVAARGLDITGISHVINYDIPENPDDYIHRIGRTARASAKGDAITFVSPDELLPLEAIERALGRNLPQTEWDGAVPVLTLFTPADKKPKGSKRGRLRRPRGLLRRR